MAPILFPCFPLLALLVVACPLPPNPRAVFPRKEITTFIRFMNLDMFCEDKNLINAKNNYMYRPYTLCC